MVNKSSTEIPQHWQIRARRVAAGLSQAQAAELVHKTRSAWMKWEQCPTKANYRQMPLDSWELFELKTADFIKARPKP